MPKTSRPCGPQGRGPPRGGHVEPVSREGQRSEVPGEATSSTRATWCRSSTRCCAACRSTTSRSRTRRRVRRLPPDVLPGQGELRRGGPRRTRCPRSGPARAAQAPGRGPGLRREAAGRGRADPSARAGEADPEGVRSEVHPQDDRARARRKKNAASRARVDEAAGAGATRAVRDVADGRSRRAAPASKRGAGSRSFFGEACGRGRGRSAAPIWPHSRSRRVARFRASTADDEQRAVVHLFAAMAMRSTKPEDP